MNLFKLKIDSVQFFQSKKVSNLSITQAFSKVDLLLIINNSLKEDGLVCDEKSLKYTNLDNVLFVEGIAIKEGTNTNDNPDYLFI
jgi:hypothetical protein